jgi:archaetidylinositol phosphate synthase
MGGGLASKTHPIARHACVRCTLKTVSAPKDIFQKSLKPRPRVEYASEYFFRPIAHLVVMALLPLRVPPPALVVFHTCLGVLAGLLIARSDFIWAAILIQIKTVLDNADGQLARASGMVSETGRYLDTEGDFVVNIALFWGLGSWTEQWSLALLAFVIFTLMLSADFNWEYLYRKERNQHFRPSPDTSRENQTILRALEWFYATVFKPQDEAIRAFSERRFETIYAKHPNAEARAQARLEYFEADSLLVLANLELSTQLAVLGLCLVLGVPELFLWFVVACGITVIGLQLWREHRAARVLQHFQSI